MATGELTFTLKNSHGEDIVIGDKTYSRFVYRDWKIRNPFDGIPPIPSWRFILGWFND